MKIYLISLAVGILVGVIYGLLNVRSPAPPVIALKLPTQTSDIVESANTEAPRDQH